MFNQNKQNQVDGFNCAPKATIKIPIPQEVALLLADIFNQKIGAVNISLEELQNEGTQLVISSIITKKTSGNRKYGLYGIYKEDELKQLKEEMSKIIKEKFKMDEEELLEYFSKINKEENERLEQEILEDEDWEDWEEDDVLYF
ncbi:hypothetical protein EDC18_103389 [Natranaerovirga pectinivora]|uniref:Uncharacterized protein n=1 Tax=Natranaerovirga pectinivora TaxID=682400 RepID=A0A4R3MLX0_9FIRM|nr:hypothetical protein [Natranaerovirga pectinivora]TCT15678.1 hypothetical protein EDC18_103389 [Natranaerovirga pectinivora]